MTPRPSPVTTLSKTWMQQAPFGVLVHFGLSSALGHQAWGASAKELDAVALDQLAAAFEPDLLDPQDWVDEAVRAGADYIIITAKHHDGFCLWPSEHSDFTVREHLHGRDVIEEFIVAARAHGLKVGLFLSLPDWHSPHFTIDEHHPLRHRPDAAAISEGRDMARFREDLKGQLTELLTRYGMIDYLYFDFSYPAASPDGRWKGKGAEDWGAQELVDLVRQLSPATLINSHAGVQGDTWNPEVHIPWPVADAGPSAEVCLDLAGTWGYDRRHIQTRSPSQIIHFIVATAAAGATTVLHVNADGRGALSGADREALRGLGAWMQRHAEALRGCYPDRGITATHCEVLRRGDTLYLFPLSDVPGYIHVRGLHDEVLFCRLVFDRTALTARRLQGAEASNQYPVVTDPDVLSVEAPFVRLEEGPQVIEIRLGRP